MLAAVWTLVFVLESAKEQASMIVVVVTDDRTQLTAA